jgi:hypothetical protein
VAEEQPRAERFAELFRAVYLAFHPADYRRGGGTPAQGSVGDQRDRDPSGARRTAGARERPGRSPADADLADTAGHEALRREREVLGVDLLARAMARLPPSEADGLNAAMRALIESAQSDGLRPEGGDSRDHDVKL